MTECESSERVTGIAVWWVTATPETRAIAAAAAAAAMRFSFMTHSFRGIFGFRPGGLSSFYFLCLTSLVSLTGVAARLAGKLHAGFRIPPRDRNSPGMAPGRERARTGTGWGRLGPEEGRTQRR